ncbi:MAG: hypothetical protein AB1753_06895 [Thermoproteota archaeon]
MSTTPSSHEEKVSENAKQVLFAMVAVLIALAGTFAYIVVEGPQPIPGEVIGFFSGAIGVVGTITGTLIQNLWGK